MNKILAKKENNLFQSQAWADFQKETGKDPVRLNDCFALHTPIMAGKSFLWIQKGPPTITNYQLPITNLGKDVVFVRIEPFEAETKEIKKLGLREVKRQSLLGGQKSPKATRILDLTKREEDLLAEMKPKTRYNLRLAEKKGVAIRASREIKDIDVFFQMLEGTAGRGKGYHHFEKNYYQKMMENLGPKDILMVYLAEYQGQAIAGILVSFYGEVATYLHGGFNPESRNLMAPFLLQWAAILEAKKRGCTVYDFWGVAETDDPKDSWQGISKFKEGFGGEKIIYPGAFDYVVNSFWYNFFGLIARVRRLVRR